MEESPSAWSDQSEDDIDPRIPRSESTAETPASTKAWSNSLVNQEVIGHHSAAAHWEDRETWSSVSCSWEFGNLAFTMLESREWHVHKMYLIDPQRRGRIKHPPFLSQPKTIALFSSADQLWLGDSYMKTLQEKLSIGWNELLPRKL